MNAVRTKHNLDFLSAPWFDNLNAFKIGTCTGQWACTWDSYCILSILNNEPGNGHLDDVFEWFEASCQRDNKNLMVLELMNKRFYRHLIDKRGFIPMDKGGDNVIKVFNQHAWKHLKQIGNDIINPKTLKCV